MEKMERESMKGDTVARSAGRYSKAEKEERLRLGIFQGDGSVFQYEAMARIFSENNLFDTALPFVYGSASRMVSAAKNLGLNDLNPLVQSRIQEVKGKRLQVLSWSGDEEKGEEDAYLLMKRMVEDLRGGHLRAVVSLPVSEENIRLRHPEFKNQAMTVAQIFPGNPFRMLLCGSSLRLSFLTTVRREDSEAYLSPQRVQQRIMDLYRTIKSDFSVTTPRIAVLGMNKDLFADRLTLPDTENLKPVITGLFEDGLPVFGPFPANAFFKSLEMKAFDAVLCMYKEQMELCLPYYPKEDICYYTAALPVVHVEPVFAGLNQEEAYRSLFRAVCTAIDIDASRLSYRRLTENPLGYSRHAGGKKNVKDEDPEALFGKEEEKGTSCRGNVPAGRHAPDKNVPGKDELEPR